MTDKLVMRDVDDFELKIHSANESHPRYGTVTRQVVEIHLDTDPDDNDSEGAESIAFWIPMDEVEGVARFLLQLAHQHTYAQLVEEGDQDD